MPNISLQGYYCTASFTNNSQKMKLLCLPHAGSGAAGYAAWNSHLGPAIEVIPVALPGRDGRLATPALTDMGRLVDTLLDELAPRLDGPYALFGHSMGAHVAFELARALRRHGQPLPAGLIVSGARAPHLGRLPPLAHLADDELLRAVALRYGTTLAPEMMDIVRLMLPTLRADIQLIESHTYRDEAPLDLPITAFAGIDDPAIPVSEVRQWGRHAIEHFTFRSFPGGHFFHTETPNAFLRSLTDTLTKLGA